MDLDAYRAKVAQVGPHPGLSPWLTDTVLLYRCRDINETEFRRRFVTLADDFESLLEKALPENLEDETFHMSATYYKAAAKCLDSYLEGIEEVLYWADTGDNNALDAGRRCFLRADRQWNKALDAALETERDFKEMDEALLRSLGGNPAGT